MELFRQIFSELAGFKSLREAVDKNISPVSVTGLSHIHRAQLIYALGDRGKIDIVITGTEAEAKKLCDDINMMAGCEEAVLFPSKELVFTPVDSTNHEYEHMRIAALIKAAKSRCSVICASIEAVMQPVIPVGVLIAAGMELTQGQEVNLTELAVTLAKCGYQRCERWRELPSSQFAALSLTSSPCRLTSLSVSSSGATR